MLSIQKAMVLVGYLTSSLPCPTRTNIVEVPIRAYIHLDCNVTIAGVFVGVSLQNR